MELTDLVHEFSRASVKRAASYVLSGEVLITEHGPDLVKAIVRGGAPYDIELRIERRRLSLSCDCPSFFSYGPCKHLWATLMVAERQGILRQMSPFDHVDAHGDDRDDGDYWEDEVVALMRQQASELAAVLEPELSRIQKAFVEARGAAASVPRAMPTKPPEWKALLASARRAAPVAEYQSHFRAGELAYVVDVERTMAGRLTIFVLERTPKKKGGFTKPRAPSIPHTDLPTLVDERDRRALPLLQAAGTLAGAANHTAYSASYRYGYVQLFSTEVSIPLTMADTVLPALVATGRFFVRAARDADLVPAAWDGDPPWEFLLRMKRRDDGSGTDVGGALRRGDEVVDLAQPLVVTAEGWVVFQGRVGRLRHFGAFGLIILLRKTQAIAVPTGEERAFLAELLAQPGVPRLELPADLALPQILAKPTPELRFEKADGELRSAAVDSLRAALSFSYEGRSIPAADPRQAVAFAEEKSGGGCIIQRDRDAEALAQGRLNELGFRSADRSDRDPRSKWFVIAPGAMPGAVRALISGGWYVEADGKPHRVAERFEVSVHSGIDWFDLTATANFGDATAALPELLRALRKGQNTVVLSDGSVGMLPEEWLKKYGVLASLGTVEGERLRFRRSQAGLLDALLATQPEVSIDDTFARARDELRRFNGVAPESAPRGFKGQLRPYQEAGLGWLSFLQRFGFGGCLADDMGLGKTIQVLAMLEGRRGQAKRPSLAVVPKSLVWNWQQEAARFTPRLRVKSHVGPDRARDAGKLAGTDLVVTTYGTLRADALLLGQMEFDCVILDEAQAIKNGASESAKAARLLRGQHRLALSGTPVENHIGELWSLFEFLNPGMLGAASAFEGATKRGRPSPETVGVLARALRPFILRRTKDRVAQELPPKHEETILCELESPQRKLYNELLDHYRANLLGRVERDGVGKAKIQVLEALLRLRQAACHPGLIDKKRADEPCAKLDVLLPRLDEVCAAGRKALVFSQDILRKRLDREKISYAYLDGDVTIKERAARVTRFQEDPGCQVFLISLKAGGMGLNLTAAEYVFVLDPWWNPAVEAQAVDRAHRIGQAKHVFVYRLLCGGTVEEKVAALQESKRNLAESIITTSESLIRDLDRQTLEMLLS